MGFQKKMTGWEKKLINWECSLVRLVLRGALKSEGFSNLDKTTMRYGDSNHFSPTQVYVHFTHNFTKLAIQLINIIKKGSEDLNGMIYITRHLGIRIYHHPCIKLHLSGMKLPFRQPRNASKLAVRGSITQWKMNFNGRNDRIFLENCFYRAKARRYWLENPSSG